MLSFSKTSKFENLQFSGGGVELCFEWRGNGRDFPWWGGVIGVTQYIGVEIFENEYVFSI